MHKKKKRSDGRYAVQVYLGLDGGKRKVKTVYGATPAEAEENAIQVKLKLRKGIDVSSDRDNFKVWADRWAKMKLPSVSNARATVYTSVLSHLEPLNYIAITRIKAFDIQDVVSALAACNPNTGKPASRKLLLEIKSVASQVFQLAIENRVLDFNPAQYVRIPHQREKSVRRALTPEEQQWIYETPHRMQIGAMIMMLAGLRRGELIPLTWGDIDFDAKTIDVSKSVEIIGGKSAQKATTKSLAGIRTVYIPDALLSFLRDHKPEGAAPSTLVLQSAHGTMLSQSAWRRLWESYWCELNLRYGGFPASASKYDPHGLPPRIPCFTAHWLRHTYVTLLYRAGVDVATAKEQAGHADVQTTLSIYTHLDRQFKKNSMALLDQYISDLNVKNKNASAPSNHAGLEAVSPDLNLT